MRESTYLARKYARNATLFALNYRPYPSGYKRKEKRRSAVGITNVESSGLSSAGDPRSAADHSGYSTDCEHDNFSCSRSVKDVKHLSFAF